MFLTLPCVTNYLVNCFHQRKKQSLPFIVFFENTVFLLPVKTEVMSKYLKGEEKKEAVRSGVLLLTVETYR